MTDWDLPSVHLCPKEGRAHVNKHPSNLVAFSTLLSALSSGVGASPSPGVGTGEDAAVRRSIGSSLLEVLDADVYVSCRLEADGSYGSPVWVNMSDANMARYQDHFQFHDPLTPLMRAAGRAARVSDVVDPRELRATEFHADFLSADGLEEGMNYFPAVSAPGTLDVRLWRRTGREPFGSDELALLQAGGDLIQRLLPAPWPAPEPAHAAAPAFGGLTARESQVASAVARGLSDRQVCRELGISLGTLRTHLSRVFTKLRVANRTALAALLASTA